MVSMRKLSWEDVWIRGRREVTRAIQDGGLRDPDPRAPLFLYGIPRGGVHAAPIFKSALLIRGYPEVYIVERLADATVLVDDIIDSGATRRDSLRELGRDVPFLALVNKADGLDLRSPWYEFPWERALHTGGGEDVVLRFLEFIQEDPTREGLEGTPNRVVKSWQQLYAGYHTDPKSVLTTFEDETCDEMVVLRDIEFYSMCEHHVLPFFGKAHIGYIPNGKVVGVSKLARVLEVFARRLQIQERLGLQVAQTLMEALEPLGVGVVLKAKHLCMMSRGVEKQNSEMMTSSMLGVFRTEPEVRAEFLRLVGQV